VLLLRKNNKVSEKKLHCLHYVLLQYVWTAIGRLQVKNYLKHTKCASNFVVVINSGLAHYSTLRNILLCLTCWLKFQLI